MPVETCRQAVPAVALPLPFSELFAGISHISMAFVAVFGEKVVILHPNFGLVTYRYTIKWKCLTV